MSDANQNGTAPADSAPVGTEPVSPLSAGAVARPWYQNGRTLAVVGIALFVGGLWALKYLGGGGASDKPVEPPAPPARQAIKVSPEPLPPPPAPAPVPATRPAVPVVAVKPPEEDMGVRAPVMAINTQSQAARAPAAQTTAAATAAPSDTAGARMVGSEIVQLSATMAGPGTYRLSAATPIPCILDTAMDTTLVGFMRCHIDKDIYSDNGATIVLEAGTVFIGEYNTSLKQGQERIGVVWTRARTPKGVTVTINSPGTDPLGRAGMDGEVETYFWTRFGAAVMFSLIQDVGAAARQLAISAATNNGGSNNTTVNAGSFGSGTQSAGTQVVGDTLRNSANIAPVLRKNQGERITILLRNDLDFSKVYKLQVD